jgi:pimeloyl-ACP methyl ester carboxylesterase
MIRGLRRARVIAGRIALVSGVLLVALALIGVTVARVAPELEPEGEMVAVDGARLHLDCKGAPGRSPTLVMVPGLGANSQCFHWLQRLLDDQLQVCRFDPMGKGFSPLSDAPRDADTVSRQLLQALHHVGAKPPYVLTGHSLGGTYAELFAAHHRDAVAGLVLLDSTHPDHLQPSLGLRLVVGSLRVLAVAADLGLVNLYLLAFGGLPDDGLPAEIVAVNRSFYRTGKDVRATASELQMAPHLFAHAARVKDLGDLPLLVVTAGARTEAPRVWMDRQRQLAKLSRRARHLTLPDANHDSLLAHREHARTVADAILDLYGTISATPPGARSARATY